MSDGYYQFSGWNKSDFNVTEDTTISGSWSGKKPDMSIGFRETSNTLTNIEWTSVCYSNGKFVVVIECGNLSAHTFNNLPSDLIQVN